MKKILYMLTAVALLLQYSIAPLVSASSAGGPECDASSVPVAFISASDTTGLTPHIVQFRGTYSDGCGDAIASYAWDFGDGTSSSDADPLHTYTAAGEWQAVLTVTDEAGLTDTDTLSVTTRETNGDPVAADDSFTFVGTLVESVIANDTDPEGDFLRPRVVSGPAHGAFDYFYSKFSYIPDEGFAGTDTFTYELTDPFGGVSNVATVTLNVERGNYFPSANDDTVTTEEDMPVTVAVLANDSDADGDPLTVQISNSPDHGSAVVNGDQTITYTPAENFGGADALTYMIRDGYGGYDIAKLYVTVSVINEVVAQADAFAGTEDTTITGSLTANDFYEEGPLTAALKGAPTYGSVSVNPDGTFVYTPRANFHGHDWFTYTVTDARGSTSWQFVDIDLAAINDTPVADFSTRTYQKKVYLTNNSTDADGDSLTYLWDFGDGSTSTETSPIHNYKRPGTYTIRLTVTDPTGAQTSITKAITL
jgi:PKD repeat protein